MLERENHNVKRMLAEYEKCFDVLGQTIRERKRLLRDGTHTEGEGEENRTRRRVRFS